MEERKTMPKRPIKLRKHVSPKSAIMCLNELLPGVKLNFELESDATDIGAIICISVEVNGQKYSGFGTTRPKAKQAAAEAALVSFVKPLPAKDDDANDKTPWRHFASFAIFKLLNEWKEDKTDTCSSTESAVSFVGADPSLVKTLKVMLSKSAQPMDPDTKLTSDDANGSNENEFNDKSNVNGKRARDSDTTNVNGKRVKEAGSIRKKVIKRTMAEKQFMVKKYVQPKKALICLQELVPGAKLKFDQEIGPISVDTPICMSVEVKGQKYSGFGASEPMAKEAAAEAAIASIVKVSLASDENAADQTPWRVVASFATYKLFNEWKEGASFGQTMPSKAIVPTKTKAKSTKKNTDKTTGDTANDDKKAPPKPSKKVPENATNMHPVMLLHQMRPTLVFEPVCEQKGDHQEFTVGCDIDGKRFEGIGPNVKKAKYDLAQKANQQLFGVTCMVSGN